jgi:quinoprotein glucose dehydrogenase
VGADECRPALGYVYLPIETPTGDFYGGHRHGDNLYADSLVCLDAKTGKKIWHYQLIHHDIWDWDIASAPILLDVTVAGKKNKSDCSAEQARLALRFRSRLRRAGVADCRTPVPQTDVPLEKTAATQPFPTKPAPTKGRA